MREAMKMSKTVVIGLDCASPQLIFEKWIDELPNIKKLTKNAIYGRLKSTIPPITVPAWMSMMTGKDPGVLGLYGFRNRKDYSYDNLFIANSSKVYEKTAWDILGENGKKVIILSVPLTYPPKKVNGCLITSFLTPNVKHNYTYPKFLKREIEQVVGEYMFDVPHFRTNAKERLLRDIYKMTEKRFNLAEHLLKTKEWDFFMMVEIGVDRIHHGFWAFHDETHPKFVPGNPFKDAIKNYYKYIDTKIGELLKTIPEDTNVMLVSDHGVRKMLGGVCINEWLIDKGYLVLKEYPKILTPFDGLEVDWSKTKAWAFGGYYGRVFFNVQGREPNGIILEEQYESFRKQIAEEISNIPDDEGNKMDTKVFVPEEIYSKIKNIPPDLVIYFDNLGWRSIGSVGSKKLWAHENDRGPDDANHDQYGMYLLKTKGLNGIIQDRNILDIALTILNLSGLKVPEDIQGKSII